MRRRNARIVIIFAVFIFLSGCVSFGPSGKGDIRLINEGAAFYQEGRYEEAIHSFDEYLKKDRTSQDAAYAWWGAGVSYEALGRYDEALRCIEMALTILPGNSNLWYAKAGILEKMGRSNEAGIARMKAEEMMSATAVTTIYTPTPITPITSITPIPEMTRASGGLTDNDTAFIQLLEYQTQELYNLSHRSEGIYGEEFISFGREFRGRVEEFILEIEQHHPDNYELKKSWSSFHEALIAYRIAGELEEAAGADFMGGNYPAANNNLQQAAQYMNQGNEFLLKALESVEQASQGD